MENKLSYGWWTRFFTASHWAYDVVATLNQIQRRNNVVYPLGLVCDTAEEHYI